MFGPTSPQIKLLLRLKSCRGHDDGDTGGGVRTGVRPSQLSTCLTLAVIILLLVINERVVLFIIDTYIKGLHPIFDNEYDRRVLARHFAVDIVGCSIVAYLGYGYRHLAAAIFNGKDVSNGSVAAYFTLDPKGAAQRVYTYVPEGHHILIYFMAYQIKNTYDSWVWKDGTLFMIHHAFALGAGWTGLYPGVAQIYGIFFMGISELSTVSLCVLGNFDPDLGVAGLAEAFPTVRLMVGLNFVVMFILVRIICWPAFAYHFSNDMKIVLERDAATLSPSSKMAMNFLFRCCQVLSFMQILFLGQIFFTAYVELSKML